MEEERSLPHLQKLATCRHAEQDQASPCPIPLFEDRI
jgi:hypothetical protein